MGPITSYTTVDCMFGGSDIGKPAPGVMQVYKDENGIPLMVDFLCPCGCGNTCPTHLVTPGQVKQANDRHWNYSLDSLGPSLSPSIRYLSGCKSHFNIVDGKVYMHTDSGK